MNLLVKCYSLLSQLSAVSVFTPESRTVPRHFNKILYYDQLLTCCSSAALDWHHVTFAAVPRGPRAATGTAILAFFYL